MEICHSHRLQKPHRTHWPTPSRASGPDVWPSACLSISIPVITGGNSQGLVSSGSKFSPCVYILCLLVGDIEGKLGETAEWLSITVPAHYSEAMSHPRDYVGC